MRNLNEMFIFLEKRLSKLEKLFKLKKFEAKQVGIIYHVCTLKAYLEWIAPKDMLQASGKYYNWVYGGDDYVSFTRDKYFVVSTKQVQASKVLVQLVIDGDKLSENYKIGPYNDFAFSKHGEHIDDGELAIYREKEEVVKGPIKNISKYIKEIRVDVVDMDKSILSQIRRAKLDGANVKYFHFIKGNQDITWLRSQDKSFAAWMKENGVKNGMTLNEVMPIFKKYINREKIDELLFAYDIDDIKEAVKKYKVNLNVHYPSGWVLENYVIDDDYTYIVKYLLDNGANPNLMMEGITPLGITAVYDCPNMAELLVNNGADLELSSSNGDTALIISAREGSESTVAKLISLGADVNAKNKSGKTAMSVAKTKQIANMLKKAGATE